VARRRTARSVKTVNTKPFVFDDVGAVPLPASSVPVETQPLSLDGRERLDERRRRWELEREKFERSRRPPTDPAAIDPPASPGDRS
jgi:hemolysin activation/secretion protein